MSGALKVFLSMSLSGSLLIGLLFACKRFVKDRFSRQWQYYLWLIVIARLLLPFAPETSLMGCVFEAADRMAVQAESGSPSLPTAQNAAGVPVAGTERPGAGKQPQSAAAPADNPHRQTVPVAEGIGAVWLGTAFILLAKKITAYRRFTASVKAGKAPVCDPALLDRLAVIAAEAGVKRPVELCIAPVSSPLLTGFFRPCIVLPRAEICERDFRYTVLHELTHYRRGDLFYKWLAQATVCLHWFNPLAHLMAAELNRACEFSCDEAIVARLDDCAAREYGKTLLDAMAAAGNAGAAPTCVTLGENKALLRERLGAIMGFRKPSKGIACAAVLFSLLLVCGAVSIGAYTAERPGTARAVSPMEARNVTLAPGGKVSLGDKWLSAGTKCSAAFTWTGGGALTVRCASSNGEAASWALVNGSENVFWIEADGAYTVSVVNETGETIDAVNGFVRYTQTPETAPPQAAPVPAQTVVYERVELRKYDGGMPYLHDVRTNNTDQTIVATECGMAAFDSQGNPLLIDWNGLDSDSEPAYVFLYDWGTAEILPGQTRDVRGGWSLDMFGEDPNAEKIAYAIYCDKSITFADGTVWENPAFGEWLDTYGGKRVDAAALERYYPFAQTVATPE